MDRPDFNLNNFLYFQLHPITKKDLEHPLVHLRGPRLAHLPKHQVKNQDLGLDQDRVQNHPLDLDHHQILDLYVLHLDPNVPSLDLNGQYPDLKDQHLDPNDQYLDLNAQHLDHDLDLHQKLVRLRDLDPSQQRVLDQVPDHDQEVHNLEPLQSHDHPQGPDRNLDQDHVQNLLRSPDQHHLQSQGHNRLQDPGRNRRQRLGHSRNPHRGQGRVRNPGLHPDLVVEVVAGVEVKAVKVVLKQSENLLSSSFTRLFYMYYSILCRVSENFLNENIDAEHV